MKTMQNTAVIIFSLLVIKSSANAQDPGFSQFFSSPLNINPALTANINSDWRAIANFRDQWIGPAAPFVTGTISYDTKVLQHKIPNVYEEKNIMGIGAMLMYDHAFNGIVRSTYGSLNLSYNIKLAEGPSLHRLGAGFGVNYGRKQMDFSRVDWEEQFTGYGFNTNLPTGESALSNMKGYFSVNAGLTYSISTEKTNMDIGVAAFHLNKPKQTFLEDQNQELPIRKVIHANFETYINDKVVLNTNAIYQYQLEAKYYSFGAALGYVLPTEQDVMLNAGLWYWSKNALIPYLGMAYKDLQFGLSYDLTVSKLRDTPKKPNTWELSVIIRGIKEPTTTIPCPWK